ncbi:putative non-specific serine/threonine protein kinase [Helianthus annuus]|nr:putative non-specific serine/threonine protein kinase [Helianthus annuus]
MTPLSISPQTNLQPPPPSPPHTHTHRKISDELQYLVNLAVLNLSSNQLSNTIPPSLSMCSYLNIIDLHDNSLTGPIPPQLGGLVQLTVFDVSDNKLSGPVPESLGNRTGNLRRFNVSSFDRNKGLYGYPLGLRGGSTASSVPVRFIIYSVKLYKKL